MVAHQFVVIDGMHQQQAEDGVTPPSLPPRLDADLALEAAEEAILIAMAGGIDADLAFDRLRTRIQRRQQHPQPMHGNHRDERSAFCKEHGQNAADDARQ